MKKKKKPNAQTRRTFERTDKGLDLNRCVDSEDLFKKLGI